MMRERSDIPAPMVLEQNKPENALVGYDVFSKLLKDRIIFIGTAIDETVSNMAVAELLYLDSQSDEPIWMYINSPGGLVSCGLGILDTMDMVQCPVYTVCIGECASMAAVLLSNGDKGHRFILKHSRVMIHQPSGGGIGMATDVEIAAKEMIRIKGVLSDILADNTGKLIETVMADCERDYWMSAKEAIDYGIVDSILYGKKEETEG